MTERWIPDEEWEYIQRTIPIPCVDVLSVRYTPAGQIDAIGLILRHTPHQGQRWCLIGGRIQFGEAITEAVTRHIRDSLGGDVQFDISRLRQPLYIAQYSPTIRPGFLQDPRKHAVSLTYALELSGTPDPQNEALDFRWFPIDKLPPSSDFGFDQDRVLVECLDRLRAHTS